MGNSSISCLYWVLSNFPMETEFGSYFLSVASIHLSPYFISVEVEVSASTHLRILAGEYEDLSEIKQK